MALTRSACAAETDAACSPHSLPGKPTATKASSRIKESSSMSKPPSFLFNAADWVASLTIQRMSDKQYRAYHLLLTNSWLDDPIASLPNDEVELARIAGVSLEVWNQIKAPILAKFKSDGAGRIFNERLKLEADYCAKRSFAGRSGWTAGRRKKQATAAKKLKHST